MKKTLILLAGVVIGACAGNAATSLADGTPRSITTSIDPGELTDDEFDRVTIDGMPCVIWKDQRGAAESRFAYSGLTCDWDER